MRDHDDWELPDDAEGGDSAHEDDLDDEFPLGDSVADVVGDVHCPYCGEPGEITLDPGSGMHQQYIEDCQVCCRPWLVSVSYDDEGTAHVHVDASDDQEDYDG
jgi:hypothetical protein